MDKKKYVLWLLKKLEPHRDKISDLIVNIELWICDDNDIENIISIIEKHIKVVKDESLKKVFEKTRDLLQSLKEKEYIERQTEEKELELLLQNIQSL